MVVQMQRSLYFKGLLDFYVTMLQRDRTHGGFVLNAARERIASLARLVVPVKLLIEACGLKRSLLGGDTP